MFLFFGLLSLVTIVTRGMKVIPSGWEKWVAIDIATCY